MRTTNRFSFIPRKLRLEVQLALRHLRSGGGQTLLTISAVAAGVIIVVFITSLIFGLQQRLTELLTERIPHVTVRVDELEPTPLSGVPGAGPGASSSRIEQRAPQRKNIENWAEVAEVVRGLPNVRVVAPVASRQGFASKGANPIGVVRINGEDIAELNDDELAILRGDEVGFIFQFHYLLDEFTCLENALIPITIRHGEATADERERIISISK